MFDNVFTKNSPVFEIKLRNIVERGMPQIIIWCMRVACWISKATNTHSEYVKLRNIVERGMPQIIIWCMRIACWISKATNTHLEYVKLIAFSLQQWLHEGASVLRYMCIACPVSIYMY